MLQLKWYFKKSTMGANWYYLVLLWHTTASRPKIDVENKLISSNMRDWGLSDESQAAKAAFTHVDSTKLERV